MKHRRCAHVGFSVIELLCVIAIVILLLAILFPVIGNARRRGAEAACISNLHQIGAATLLYSEDSGGRGPEVLFGEARALLPYVKSNKQVFACPLDTFNPGAEVNSSSKMRSRVSYFSPLTVFSGYFEALEQADPNHGLWACLMHGDWAQDADLNPVLSVIGKVLVVRKDLSVTHHNVDFRCWKGPDGGLGASRWNWDFFTTEPPPSSIVEQLIGKGSQVIPCLNRRGM